MVDVQGAGARDLLTVVVRRSGAAGQLAAGLHRRRHDRLGNEDLVTGVAPSPAPSPEFQCLNLLRVYPVRSSSVTFTRPTASASVVTSGAGAAEAACAAGEERRGTRSRESAPKVRTKFLITTAFYRPHPTPGDALRLVPTRPPGGRGSPRKRSAARGGGAGPGASDKGRPGTRGPSRTPETRTCPAHPYGTVCLRPYPARPARGCANPELFVLRGTRYVPGRAATARTRRTRSGHSFIELLPPLACGTARGGLGDVNAGAEISASRAWRQLCRAAEPVAVLASLPVSIRICAVSLVALWSKGRSWPVKETSPVVRPTALSMRRTKG